MATNDHVRVFWQSNRGHIERRSNIILSITKKRWRVTCPISSEADQPRVWEIRDELRELDLKCWVWMNKFIGTLWKEKYKLSKRRWLIRPRSEDHCSHFSVRPKLSVGRKIHLYFAQKDWAKLLADTTVIDCLTRKSKCCSYTIHFIPPQACALEVVIMSRHATTSATNRGLPAVIKKETILAIRLSSSHSVKQELFLSARIQIIWWSRT